MKQKKSFSDFRDVQILGSAGDRFRGRALVHTWSERDAFWRGGKKAAKIVGIVGGCFLPFCILEPFLFMIWGSIMTAILFLGIGPYLHLKYWNEQVSFEYVESECPSCHQPGRLTPYVSTSFEEEFTVLCRACGQTARAVQPEHGPASSH